MERVEGAVEGLEYERHRVGRGRAGRPAPTVHIYHFLVAGQPVELRHGDALPINDGDEVTVAARPRRGVYRAYAWDNHTWGARLVEPRGMSAAMRGWLPAIPAGVLLLPAFGLWHDDAGLPARAASVCAALVAAGFGIWAVRGFIEYVRYRRAARLLDAGSTDRPRSGGIGTGETRESVDPER